MSEIELVKNRILSKSPLEVLIGEQVTLQKRSGRYLGCCPFHEEKSPSFYLYHDHYHCFGCGAHGDAITYVQKQQGLAFIESLRWLAQKFSIPAPELDRSKSNLQQWQKNTRLNRIIVEAHEYFVANLYSEKNVEAQNYLIARGFQPSTWKEIGFGYALDFPDHLIKTLRSKGYTLKELEAVSLANSFENKSYDFFRHRITVPIRDTYGRLIAFGGRALGGQQQKYKNSRYDKGTTLFAMDKARKAMRTKLRGIVVEGYLDAVKMHLYGFAETVACQGTALTREHMRALKSATNTVYLLFDGDKAGRNASLKLLSTSLDFPDIQFKVVELPEAYDPDSYLSEFGSEKLEELLRSSLDLIDFGISSRLTDCHASAIPSLISQEFIPWLSKLGDPIQKSFLIDKISRLTGVDKKAIENAEVNKVWRDESKETQGEIVDKEAEKDEQENGYENVSVSQLNPIIFEFLGHLFFTTPEDNIDVEMVEQFLDSSRMVEEIWILFAKEVLAVIKKNKKPKEIDISTWVSAHAKPVMELLQKLNELQLAFKQTNRKKMLQRLMLLDKKNKLKCEISTLQDNMLIARRNSSDSNNVELKRLGEQFLLAHKELRKNQMDINNTR